MVKNTFKLVFIYAIILGIAGAIASGFINMGLIIFSLLDDWAIGYDSATESFSSQNNYIMLTIYKIIASILALLPLMLFIKFSTGAFIFKPLQLLAFTGRAGLNTVNRTGRGLFNAARNGIGNSMNAIKSIAKGDPMSMYRSARYAEMALGRNNKLSNILRRGADISDFSQNLAGNKGEAKEEEDKDKKDGFFSKVNEKTQPKKTEDLLSGRARRNAVLHNIKKAEKAKKNQLKKDMKNLDPESDEYKDKKKQLEEAKENISMANKGLASPALRQKTKDKYDDFIKEYDDAHENLRVTDLKNNNVPGAFKTAQNFLNNHITQILNASSTPAITPTNAEGERAVKVGSHSGALPVDEQIASDELDKISKSIGVPSKHMAGLATGQTGEEERQEIIDRVEAEGRGIPSAVQSASQLLGSSAAIYGAHLNSSEQFDSNATSQRIQQGHLDNAEMYKEGVQSSLIRENLGDKIRTARQEARMREGLFSLDNSEYEEIKRNHQVGQVVFKDEDSDMLGFAGKASVYRRDRDGNKAVRFENMEVRDIHDPDMITKLKEVDVLLDPESQSKVKKDGLSNEEIVQGIAEGTLGAVAVKAIDGENNEKEIGIENISFVEQVRREVELKDKNYENSPQTSGSTIQNDNIKTENAQQSDQVASGSTQRVETVQKEYIQPGETKTIQGSPMSSTVTNNTVQEVNNIAGSQVATVSDNGEMKISLNNEQIERLSAMRYKGESTKEANGSEDTANFINNLLDSLLPGSSSSDSPTVNNNYTNSDDNRTNNVSNYRNGDSVNITVNPSSGEQTFERSSRKETSASAPDVTIDGINKDLYDAQQSRNSRMLDEQLERSQEQLGKEERGNRLGGEER